MHAAHLISEMAGNEPDPRERLSNYKTGRSFIYLDESRHQEQNLYHRKRRSRVGELAEKRGKTPEGRKRLSRWVIYGWMEGKRRDSCTWNTLPSKQLSARRNALKTQRFGKNGSEPLVTFSLSCGLWANGNLGSKKLGTCAKIVTVLWPYAILWPLGVSLIILWLLQSSALQAISTRLITKNSIFRSPWTIRNRLKIIYFAFEKTPGNDIFMKICKYTTVSRQ